MTIGEIYFNTYADNYSECKLLNTWRAKYGVMYLFGHYGNDGQIGRTYAISERQVRQYIEGAFLNENY